MHDVVVHSVAVGVARHIQPMTSPALPVARRSQQSVNHMLERNLGIVANEVFDFFGSGRQPVQIEGRPPDQRSLVRSGSRPQSLLDQPMQQERVDGRPTSRWDGRVLGRLKCPVRPFLLGEFSFDRSFLLSAPVWRSPGIRPDRAPIDPLRQQIDLREGQLLLGRHLQQRVVVDCVNQQAALRLTRHDRRTRTAAREHSRQRIQPQARLSIARVRPVAGVAATSEDRANLLLEEVAVLRDTEGRETRGERRDAPDCRSPGHLPCSRLA